MQTQLWLKLFEGEWGYLQVRENLHIDLYSASVCNSIKEKNCWKRAANDFIDYWLKI